MNIGVMLSGRELIKHNFQCFHKKLLNYILDHELSEYFHLKTSFDAKNALAMAGSIGPILHYLQKSNLANLKLIILDTYKLSSTERDQTLDLFRSLAEIYHFRLLELSSDFQSEKISFFKAEKKIKFEAELLKSMKKEKLNYLIKEGIKYPFTFLSNPVSRYQSKIIEVFPGIKQGPFRVSKENPIGDVLGQKLPFIGVSFMINHYRKAEDIIIDQYFCTKSKNQIDIATELYAGPMSMILIRGLKILKGQNQIRNGQKNKKKKIIPFHNNQNRNFALV